MLTFVFCRMRGCPLKPSSNILFIWCRFPGQGTVLLSFVSLSGEYIHHSLTNGNNRLIRKKCIFNKHVVEYFNGAKNIL